MAGTVRDSPHPLQHLRSRGRTGNPGRRFRQGRIACEPADRNPAVGRGPVRAGPLAGGHRAARGGAAAKPVSGWRRKSRPRRAGIRAATQDRVRTIRSMVLAMAGESWQRGRRGPRRSRRVNHTWTRRSGWPWSPSGFSPGQIGQRLRGRRRSSGGRRGGARRTVLPHGLPGGPRRHCRDPRRRLDGGGNPPGRLRGAAFGPSLISFGGGVHAAHGIILLYQGKTAQA